MIRFFLALLANIGRPRVEDWESAKPERPNKLSYDERWELSRQRAADRAARKKVRDEGR